MPRMRQSGGVNYGGTRTGGGPDAAFLQNVSPATASFNSGSDDNPYANVGKFNLAVMSPGSFSQSMASNVENGGLIHGMASGIFGPGAALGGVPVVSGAVTGAAGLLDWTGSNVSHLLGGTGDVLANLGKVKINPFADLATAQRFNETPETPEKAEIRAQGGGFWGNAEAQAKYLVELDRQHYKDHPEDTGPLGLYGILPEASEYGAVNRGDLGQAVGIPLMGLQAISRYFARALAGSQAAGFLRNEWTVTDNAIEILSKRPPEELTGVQVEAVAKYKSGEWSNDKAIDFLIANNAGLNDNPIVNMVMEAFLDPSVYGTIGASLLARGGAGAIKVATTLRRIDTLEAAGEMTTEAAALSRQVVGMSKSAIKPLIRGIEKEVADGTITEAQGKLRIAAVQNSGLGRMEGFLTRTIGPYALPVMMHPTYGPIAAKVHNLIDPTRILFPEKNHASRVLKSRLSVDATAAVTHAHGLVNTDRVYQQIAKFKPDLAQRVMDDIGGYTAGLTRVWAGNNIAQTILKRAQPTFGDISQAIDTRLANLPDDFFVQLEYLAVDVMPLNLTPEGVATRMAVAYGDEAADYMPLLQTLNYKGLAYLHAATTQRARGDLLSAIAKQAAAGTWKHPVELAKLILIAPGELTKQRADALLKILKSKTLSDEEKLVAARAAVQQYDILRKSHSLPKNEEVLKILRNKKLSAAERDAAVREAENRGLLTGDVDVDGVKKIIKHIETLKKEKALAAEMRASDIAKLKGEVFDWTTRYGRTADGEPMYTIGFRPPDEALWRAVRDADSGDIVHVAPWVDYVAEAAAGFRPGFGRTLPGMAQRPADWLQIAKDNLFHSVSTQRVAIEAENRFIRIGVTKLGMTENEARLMHTKLDQTAQSGEHAMRGLSATDMWKSAETVLPYRLRGLVGRRQIVDAVLESYKSEFHVVGATQIVTGALKQYLDRIPFMNMGGGNYIGQISEKAWPNLKFKFNPYFQFQEMGEGQFFSVLKGIMPYWRGAISPLDERAFRVWGTFDQNLEGIGDQLERSVAVTWGSVGETLSGSTGIKRIKYVNAVRQWRKTLGEQIRQQWQPEFLEEMRAHYHTLDDGEVAIRFLDEMTMENRRVLTDVLELGETNAYEDIIKAAAWAKPANMGVVAPLYMKTVARLFEMDSEGELIRAVRSKNHPLTSSDVANKLRSMNAHPGYIERVVNDLKFMGIENWWKRMAKAYDMSDVVRDQFRAMERGTAAAMGMSEAEWISQRFSNDVKVFGDPTKLPSTGDILMNAVRMTLQEKNKVVYAADDPEVLKMLQIAQEQYGLSVPNPKKLAELQGAHDRVHANPAAYSPGPAAGHTHTANGNSHTTGEVDFATFSKGVEDWVGGGTDEAGRLRNSGAIYDATRWYRELPGMILGLVDGDVEKAAKIYLAWTYSQKSDSPMQGFIRTMRAHDRHQFATEQNMVEFFRDDLGLAREAIASVMKGEPVTSGLGIKLWDFSGAALGMNKRVVGHLAPSPADRWAFRGAGFMDSQGLGQFMRAYGYRTPEEAGYLDPAPYVQPVWTKEVDDLTGERIQKVNDEGELVFKGDYRKYQEALDKENLRRSRMRKNKLPPLKRVYTSVGKNEYEYVTKWLNDMTAQANAAEWMGKTDWQPRDLQALDWLRIQHAFGAYPESGADMMHAVSTQLALSVDPMKRGPWGTHIEDFGQFTEQDRSDFVQEMAYFTAAGLSDRLGIIVPEVHFGTHGVHLREVTPWMALTIAGTNEPASRGLLSMMAMHQADYGVAIREVPDFKTARVRGIKNGEEVELGFRHAIDFHLPEGASNDIVRMLSETAELEGETLVPFTRNGEKVIRWVWHRTNADGRVMSTTAKQVNEQMRLLREELDATAGLSDVRMTARSVHVEEVRHDWAADPQGHAISRRLGGLGPAGLGADRQLFGGARGFGPTYRGATPAEHAGVMGREGSDTVSPLVGETRAERDRIVARYLRNPVRGRATPNGAYVGDTGAVADGAAHGLTVAAPRTLTDTEQALVNQLHMAGNHEGAANLRRMYQGYVEEELPPRRVAIDVASGRTVREITQDMGARDMWVSQREDLHMIHPRSGFRVRNNVPAPHVIADETGFPVVEYLVPDEHRMSVLGEPVAGMGHDLKYVFRAISEEDYQGILRKGYMKSDERMNLGPEGTVASIEDPSWYLPGKLNSTPLGDHPGRIVRIQVRREDGWKLNTKGGDGYIKTDAKIPLERIDKVSPKIVTRKYKVTTKYGTDMEQTHTYIDDLLTPKAREEVNRYLDADDYKQARIIESNATGYPPGRWDETSHARFAQPVSVDFLSMIPRGNRLGKTNITELSQELIDRGVDEPLIIEYSPASGGIRLIEGNHRVAAAKLAGIENLPVRVVSKKTPFHPNDPFHPIDRELAVQPDEFGYVSQDLTPTQAGMGHDVRTGFPRQPERVGPAEGPVRESDFIDQMRRRVPGAYLEDDATKAGQVSLVPFDNMMRAAGMRPSMFSLEAPETLARNAELRARGFDEPIALEYSIKDDAVRFRDKDDRLTLEAAEGDFEYIPARVIIVEEFDPNHPQWGNWPGENIFSPLTEDEDSYRVLQEMIDEGGGISPEDLGMAVDRGFGEGLQSMNWMATHEISQTMTGHAAAITQTPGYPLRGGAPATIGASGERMVERFLEGIYDSPGGRINLYSGQRIGLEGHGRYENPEVGDVVTFPLKATSPNPEMAHRFSQGTNWQVSPEPGFVYAFPEGTRGIVQDERAEIVVSGRFRVANVIEMDPMDLYAEGPRSAGIASGYADMSQPVKVVELEPVEIFNPHSRKWEPYHRTQAAEPDTSGMTYLSQSDEVVRGASTVGKDGRITLWASKDSASPMVFAHEMAHAMHVHLSPSMRERVIKQFNLENKRRLVRWNREVSEWFAESYVRYLREGSVHQDPEMNRAFRFFAKWTDKAIKKGLLKGETNLAARGALSAEEGARLQAPLRPSHKAILEEITAGPKAEATHYNASEEAVWTAATDAVRAAGYDAFRVNFFKRNRSLLERSVNHPIFGLYPASYMWGKVLPEMVRFIAKDPFGLPGGHVAWASQDVWRSIQQQSVLDPEFAKAMEDIGKNGAIRFLALSMPGSPWELSVNSAAWTRRLAQAGLENEALARAGKKPKDIDYFGIFKDTMQYQFGTIPNTFDAALKGVSGLEDLYASARGEPTTGKKAPSIGKGLETVTANINSFGDEIGENLPSINDVFATDESNVQDISDITAQSDELQAELDDAQMQLQSIFERYPFTQQ